MTIAPNTNTASNTPRNPRRAPSEKPPVIPTRPRSETGKPPAAGRPWRKWALLLAVSASVVAFAGPLERLGARAAAFAFASARAGLLQDPAPARDADLLKADPFDRLTLNDGVVVEIEPLYPRPLPKIDLDEVKRLVERNEKRKPENREPIPNLNVFISLKEGEIRDFMTDRTKIRSLEYFEDLLINEARKAAAARDFTRAFELLLRAQRFSPNWEGLAEAIDRLLYDEAEAAVQANEIDRGLRLLLELYERNPQYPQLREKLFSGAATRIGQRLAERNYRAARALLESVAKIDPAAPEVAEARRRFAAEARAIVDRANARQGYERYDLLVQALEIWPELEGGRELLREAFESGATLEVAVFDLPRVVTPFVPSPSAERLGHLLYRPVLLATDDASARGEVPGQLARSVDKTEIGRRLTVQLRTDVPWSDGSRVVNAFDVASALADRGDPNSRFSNSRFSSLLERVQIDGPDRVVVNLVRPTVRPEAWLLANVGPSHIDRNGLVAVRNTQVPVTNGRYRWNALAGDELTIVAADPLSDERAPQISRVRERLFRDPETAVQALADRRVALLAHVPAEALPRVAALPGVRVGRHDVPRVHVLALDARNPAFRNRSLRRGLSFAIDRKTILEETVLRRPVDDDNAPANGVHHRGSYADVPDVPPLESDPLLAKMLVGAGRRELGGQALRFRFEYPTLPEVRAAVPRIVEMLSSAGIQVEPIERSWHDLEERLRRGERFEIAYRVVACREPDFESGPAICPGYDAPESADGLGAIASPRIMQLLLALEQAPDPPAATEIVRAIDREIRDELPVIPLWQILAHYAWTENLQGVPDNADRLYRGIEDWRVTP